MRMSSWPTIPFQYNGHSASPFFDSLLSTVSMPAFNLFGSSKSPSRERRKGSHPSDYSTDGYIPQPLPHDPLVTGSFGVRASAGPEDRFRQRHPGPRSAEFVAQDVNKSFNAPPGTYTEGQYRSSIATSEVPSQGGTHPATLPGPSSRTQTPVPAVHRESTGLEVATQSAVAPLPDSTLSKDERVWPSDTQFKGEGSGRGGALPPHVPSVATSRRHMAGARSHRSDDESEREHYDSLSDDRGMEPSPLLFSSRPSERSERHGHTPRYRGEVIQPIHYEQERHYRRKWSEEGHNPMYYHYIIPAGINVILRDDDGNELARIGNFNRPSPYPPSVIVQDDVGRELYRVGDFDNSSTSSLGRYQDPWGQSSDSEYQYDYRDERERRRSSRDRRDKRHRSRHRDDHEHREHRHRSRSRPRKYEDDYMHSSARMDPMRAEYSQPYPYGYPPTMSHAGTYPMSSGSVMILDEYGRQVPMSHHPGGPGGAHPRSPYGHHSRSYR